MGLTGGFDVIVVWAVMSALIWIGIPVGIFLFARRFLRAAERRSLNESQLVELREHVQRLEARLEARLDDVADDTARLREDQRFTRELLLERPTKQNESSSGAA